jgi:hypothetical protein
VCIVGGNNESVNGMFDILFIVHQGSKLVEDDGGVLGRHGEGSAPKFHFHLNTVQKVKLD